MRILFVLGIATCAWLLPLPSEAQTCKALSPADVSKINDVTQTLVKAALAKDWATFAAQYVDDAVVNPPNQPAVRGRAAIRAWLATFPPFLDFRATNVKVEGCNDLAYVLGDYSQTLAPPGATPAKDSGKYVEVRRKQADGRWLVVVDIFNSNLPAATPPQAK